MSNAKPNLLKQASEEKLRDLYVAQNLTLKVLAKRFECSVDMLRKQLRKFSIYKAKDSSRALYRVPREELAMLYLGKLWSTRDIARKYGSSHYTVIHLLHAYGIRRRTTSESNRAFYRNCGTLVKLSNKAEG